MTEKVEALLHENQDLNRLVLRSDRLVTPRASLDTGLMPPRTLHVDGSSGPGPRPSPQLPGSPFEQDLETSRVYRRATRMSLDLSVRSSVAQTHAWSMFSGLSLGQISNLSVLALPLYADDITNAQHYAFHHTLHATGGSGVTPSSSGAFLRSLTPTIKPAIPATSLPTESFSRSTEPDAGLHVMYVGRDPIVEYVVSSPYLWCMPNVELDTNGLWYKSIIAVHGLNGHWEKTWWLRNERLAWPKPEVIKPVLDLKYDAGSEWCREPVWHLEPPTLPERLLARKFTCS